MSLESPPRLTGGKIALLAIGVVLMTSAAIAGLWWWLGRTELSAAELTSARLDAVKIGLSIGVGSGGIFALYLGWRRQRSTEDTLAHQERVAAATEADAAQRRITDLYLKAVEQLGSSQAPVRLGGLYALERLAQDNPDQRQTIVNVLAAYLRMPYSPPSTTRPIGIRRPAPSASRDTTHQEREVRLAAQRILTTHLRPDDPTTFWTDIDLDLSGATLIDLDLFNCRLRTATFTSARCIGRTYFDNTEFTDNAIFDSVEFNSDVLFTRAQFNGITTFQGSRFASEAGFEEARFSGQAWFNDAQFNGDALFSEARFSDYTTFYGVQFTGNTNFGRTEFADDARFEDAKFSSDAVFNKIQFGGVAQFNLAEFSHDADFTEARFAGSTSFRRAVFAHDGGFHGTSFTGDTWFDAAHFTGSGVFNTAHFSGTASFRKTEFTGKAWFHETRFERDAGFDEAHFSHDARFDDAQFAADAWFGCTHFTGTANFSETQFSNSVRIDGAVFASGIPDELISFTSPPDPVSH